MECHVYKGKRKPDHYLFISSDNAVENIPDEIRQMFGELEQVMCLELTTSTKLARSDPEKVINMINEKGFYIQIPPRSNDLINKPEL